MGRFCEAEHHVLSLTLSQWQFSVPGIKTQVYTGIALEEELLVASAFPVVFQWSFSELQVVFHCVPIMQINTGTPLCPSISQCGPSGIPVYVRLQCSSSVFQLCKLTLGRHWDTTGC